MEIIYTDASGVDQGCLQTFKKFDLTTSGTRDFELQIGIDDYNALGLDYGSRIYIDGTEYGGSIQDIKVNTGKGVVYATGITWRGLLTRKIIEPPTGEDYLIVSGEANEVIGEILGSAFGSLFSVSTTDSGITISTYAMPRYADMLTGLDTMLRLAGAKLRVSYSSTDSVVELSAAEAVDYSNDDYSSDKIQFIARDYRRGINHLICLGAGQLASREVVHLYQDADGNITETQFYTGVDDRAAVYDYANAESTDDLKNGGKARLRELANYSEMSAEVEEINPEPGDYVTGTEEITGLSVRTRVTGVTLTITRGKETITYETEESEAETADTETGGSGRQVCGIAVGDILESTLSANPSTRYPGTTWEAFGAGRVIVGYDASQTEFDEGGKSGGSKTEALQISEIPSHNHPIRFAWGPGGQTIGSGTVSYLQVDPTPTPATGNTGGGEPHNNLQPYITCYRWLRLS